MGQGLDTCTVVEGGVIGDSVAATVPGGEIDNVSEEESAHSRVSPPDRVRFDELGPVRRLLKLLQSEGTFTIGHIKRSMEAFVAQREDVEVALGMVKPNGPMCERCSGVTCARVVLIGYPSEIEIWRWERPGAST